MSIKEIVIFIATVGDLCDENLGFGYKNGANKYLDTCIYYDSRTKWIDIKFGHQNYTEIKGGYSKEFFELANKDFDQYKLTAYALDIFVELSTNPNAKLIILSDKISKSSARNHWHEYLKLSNEFEDFYDKFFVAFAIEQITPIVTSCKDVRISDNAKLILNSLEKTKF